jgi:hypothetical protein
MISDFFLRHLDLQSVEKEKPKINFLSQKQFLTGFLLLSRFNFDLITDDEMMIHYAICFIGSVNGIDNYMTEFAVI